MWNKKTFKKYFLMKNWKNAFEGGFSGTYASSFNWRKTLFWPFNSKTVRNLNWVIKRKDHSTTSWSFWNSRRKLQLRVSGNVSGTSFTRQWIVLSEENVISFQSNVQFSSSGSVKYNILIVFILLELLRCIKNSLNQRKINNFVYTRCTLAV